MYAALLLPALCFGFQDADNAEAPQSLGATIAEAESVPLFDGQTLDGWRGQDGLWSVEDGAIVGRTSAEAPLKVNTFLIRDEPAENFELRLNYKIEGGNSGVQYRAEVFDEDQFRVRGPQADIDSSPKYSGIHYSEQARGIVALRGQMTKVVPGGKKGVNQFVGTCGDPATLQKKFVKDGWNEYRIVADGPTMSHYINGQLMSRVTDTRPDRETAGVIALQLHQGPPMVVRFKDVTIKRAP
ncbi:3-keto-disaccharide hydrolase [Alienimonas chondri]|uniref:3-keto-alpha-glucoside-1,2-lyase/3-keto-2-hydroxy-glucal hydratase domain-containing protein n=1 Tax=Alienimonas chondri TaxID=2681879 RepID=A0ABX1VH63_9PLAN|nr:DUF1080 domain-containing protein [Alienimonas chondri]NNJ27187.1 hypothetical protein [Alienimonas chondri]